MNLSTGVDNLNINPLWNHSYRGNMSAARKPATTARRAAPKAVRDGAPKVKKPKPNRIQALAKARHLTYGDIAEALSTHEVTIARLANGLQRMNEDWQRKLSDFFQVPLADIMEKPAAEGLRAVPVMLPLQAGDWSESHEFDEEVRTNVMVPDDPNYRNLTLYAGRVVGDSMNKIYPNGTIVVLTRMVQRPNEILPGKRYHIRRTSGGVSEETIKTLIKDSKGRYWMQPESDSPEYTAVPLEGGSDDETIELIGRVRWSVRPED